jgi:hypothetical protein
VRRAGDLQPAVIYAFLAAPPVVVAGRLASGQYEMGRICHQMLVRAAGAAHDVDRHRYLRTLVWLDRVMRQRHSGGQSCNNRRTAQTPRGRDT